MKTIYKFLTLILLFSATACDNVLDINTDPNKPTSASSEMLLSSATMWTAAYVGGDLELVGSIWAQHYAQNNTSQQYASYDNYQIDNTDFARVWRDAYAGALPDLYEVKDKSAMDGQWGNWIMAQTLIAFNYHVLVDLYSSIPFSQAVNENYEAPIYDDGKTVNEGIIAILDSVLEKQADVDNITNTILNNDFIFAGDVNKWLSFARTLKLKLLMRDFEANSAEITSLLSEGGFLTEDASVKGFQDRENNSNPLYENDRRKLNTTNNLKGSATMISFLLENNDPRIASYYDLNSADAYWGILQGGYKACPLPSNVLSRASLSATDPVYFVSAAETDFLQAESYARLDDAANAEMYYNSAVTAAFARWGYDASSFLAGPYLFDASSQDSMLKCILVQKWVASVRCQAWDAFFDINRTGYPTLGAEFPYEKEDFVTPNPNYVSGMLTPSIESVLGEGEYPKRFFYPKNSTDGNGNAPTNVSITTKMWWQQ